MYLKMVNLGRCFNNFFLFVYISEMRYYIHYLHFSDSCPHFWHHVYPNVSVVVRFGLLQVVGMSNLTLFSLNGVDCSNSTFSHEKPLAAMEILNGYESQLLLFTYIRSTAADISIQIRRGLQWKLMATRLLVRKRTQPYGGRGVYISIVIHRQICFVLSELISVARY